MFLKKHFGRVPSGRVSRTAHRAKGVTSEAQVTFFCPLVQPPFVASWVPPGLGWAARGLTQEGSTPRLSPRDPTPQPIYGPGVEAGRAVPVNTSLLTCAFFFYDFSCFDETLTALGCAGSQEGTEALAGPASQPFRSCAPRPAPRLHSTGAITFPLCVNGPTSASPRQFPRLPKPPPLSFCSAD